VIDDENARLSGRNAIGLLRAVFYYHYRATPRRGLVTDALAGRLILRPHLAKTG
jgi:hypothetical protein